MHTYEDVRAIAERYLDKVRTTGSENVMAVCPFHSRSDGSPERNPSFAMNTTNGLFFCHSCGAAGNLRKFLKLMGVSGVVLESMYKYVLEAAEASVAPAPDPMRPQVVSMRPMDDALLGLYDYCPQELLDSGFRMETLKYFEVGIDQMYYRVTFPIRDLQGQLVAINGRATQPGQEPRYKVYEKEYAAHGLPERGTWDKRTVLYHAHHVYPSVFHDPNPRGVVIVEGYKACMWLVQAGISTTMALQGSYLSWEHRWILERLGAPVYLFLDNNRAGWSGAYKAAHALRQSLPVYIVQYPERLADYEDAQPDDCDTQEVYTQLNAAPNWYQFIGTRTRTPAIVL